MEVCGVRRLFPLPGSAAAASLVSGGRQPALVSPTHRVVRTVKAESRGYDKNIRPTLGFPLSVFTCASHYGAARSTALLD